MLRGLKAKLGALDRPNPVVREISFRKEGTHFEVLKWLEDTTRVVKDSSGAREFQTSGHSISREHVKLFWEAKGSLNLLDLFFCHLLSADERLSAANPPDSIAVTREGPKHPIHFLQWNDSIEARISELFEEAFGSELVVHRNAGRNVPLLVGQKPQLKDGQDRVSIQH